MALLRKELVLELLRVRLPDLSSATRLETSSKMSGSVALLREIAVAKKRKISTLYIVAI